jgi:hypothetical protein
MKRWSLALCVAAVAFTATPAAASYSIVQWPILRDCKIWNDAFPTRPVGPHRVLATRIPDFHTALDVLARLSARGACTFGSAL